MNSSSDTSGRAVIIGGGLAGMVIAKLLKQGVPVLILEKDERMGGKAGADWNSSDQCYEEHGYHVFPSWYANTLALIDEIGISGAMVSVTRFHYLLPDDPDEAGPKRKGVYPQTLEFHQLDSLRAILHNIFCGIVPWHEALLSFYAVLDLCSQPLKRARFLDLVSVNGFLRSRWYASDTMARFHQQTVLQASAIANFKLSAMTMKNLVHNWSAAPKPLFRILDGNLQQKFIDPLEQHVRQQGASIRLQTEVKGLVPNEEQICKLQLHSSGKASTEELGPHDICVITTPLEVTGKLVDDTVFACEQKNIPNRNTDYIKPICFVDYLESAPMAAFQFYLRRKIPNIPAEHVNLYDSKYGLSFIDLSQTWDEFSNDYTVLSVIASDFEPLMRLSEHAACRCIFEELQRFIPVIASDDIERVYPQVNVKAPLFLNTVGSWRCRPRTRTLIRNLYIAGDYCQSDADLTTMESAVISARRTAADILKDLGRNHDPAMPIPLLQPYPWAFWVLKWLLLPFAIALRLVFWSTKLKN